MIIANALYDVVFKYLMEDRGIAKLLLSGLLQTEVSDLELMPQEYAADLKDKVLTVYRIDFKAKIKLKDGTDKMVLIELQKAKFATDIMRFRRYLGKQYAHKGNVVEKNGKKYPLPIITVYFLGYPIKEIADIPVIRVVRKYLDVGTNKELSVKAEFIESLTHDSIIVQVGAIKKKRRKNELEKALAVFEPGTKHEISINENDYPEKYKPVIRRLLKAVQDQKVRETMEVEDEILAELEDKERLAEKALQLMEKERKEKEEALKREKEAKLKLASKMLKYGESKEDIKKETGLSLKEIERLRKR